MQCPILKIYTLDIAPLREQAVFEELYGAVSEARRAKTDRMRLAGDKYLSLGAEYLLMCACADFGLDYHQQRVVIDGNGKPRFDTCSLCFNLSHSQERAICVMSVYPVGCDVEKVRSVSPTLATRFFATEECRLLNACPTQLERERLFFQLWTLKESFMKCTGLGFALPLKNFCVVPSKCGWQVVQTVDSNASYRLFEIATADGYQYAWCVRANPDDIPCDAFVGGIEEKKLASNR